MINNSNKIDKKITLYKIVTFLKPYSSEIYDLIGNLYFDRKEFNNAIKYYKSALRKNKNYFESYKNLARVYLEFSEYDKVKDFFDKAYKIQRVNNSINHNLKTTIFKIKHDIGHINYLVENKYISDKYLEIVNYYNKIIDIYNNKDIFIDLDKKFHNFINKNIFIYQLKEYNSVINKSLDFKIIQDKFKLNDYIYFDSFLTEEVINELYKYCLLSTIWHGDKKTGAYIGSYIDDGFNNQIIYKIAEEIKFFLPEIFKNLPLLYVWAYKYDSEYQGIDAHADKALINVNFWVTPNKSNLDPNSGGLIIYNTKPPQDWDFYDYNSHTDLVEDFLLKNQSSQVSIPYKQNRCIIFDSSLFHKSDMYSFKNDYEDKRINITMLFGHKT